MVLAQTTESTNMIICAVQAQRCRCCRRWSYSVPTECQKSGRGRHKEIPRLNCMLPKDAWAWWIRDLRPPCSIGSAGPYIVSRLCAVALAAASVASLSCLVSNFSKFLLMPCKNQTYFLFRRHCIRTFYKKSSACQLQVWKLMIFWKFLFSQYDRLKKRWSQQILWSEFCSYFL